MECPVCFDPLKGPKPSLVAMCQSCSKNFHIECLIASEAGGTKGCPMCRCVWPVELVDDETEIFWTCEECEKIFKTKEACETHEERCGKSCLPFRT
jgi:hypothetical protein